MPTDSNLPNITAEETVSSTETAGEVAPKAAEESPMAAPSTEATTPSAAPAAKSQQTVVNAKAASFSFTGLDKNGVPTGFTVTDSSGALGSLYMTNRQPVLSETELTLSQVVKTDTGAANIFLSQQLVSDSRGFDYRPTVSYGKAGMWAPLVTSVTYLDSERLMSGNYLVTAIIKVESEVDSTVVIPASAYGRDLLQAPRQVITRLVLNPGKTQILAQAIQVVERVGK
jgi:hypothetical protein